MKAKAVSIILSIIIAVNCFCVFPSTAAAAGSKVYGGALESVLQNPELYSDTVASDSSLGMAKKSAYQYRQAAYDGDSVNIEREIRDAFLRRDTNCTFNVASYNSYYANAQASSLLATRDFIMELINGACSDELSSSVNDGDYLMWTFGGAKSYSVILNGYSNGVYFYTFNIIGIEYYTTLSEEALVDQWVRNYFASFNINEYTDYQLVKKFHDDICNATVYDFDYENTMKSNMYDFSAYGALCMGKAVCQGYALAFYRLCREAGISCRFIASNELGNHAWNLVSMGGQYFYVDCTWDDGTDGKSFTYDYFLVTQKELSRNDKETMAHTPDKSMYNNDYFNSNYGNYISQSSFNRYANNLYNATASMPAFTYAYTGAAVCPAADVYYNGYKLNCTYSYINNINAGMALVRIYGTDNYSSMWIQRKFDIGSIDMSSYNMTVSQQAYVFDGGLKTPAVNTCGLNIGTDCTVSYSNNVYPGTGYAAVSGIGNYSGSKIIPFYIIPAAVQSFAVKSTSVTTANLSWSAQPGIDYYVISKLSSGTWKDIASVPAGTTSYKISSLSGGKSYDYCIYAVDNQSGRGALSASVQFCTKPSKAKISKKTTKSKSITVKWKKTSCTGYQLQYSTSSKFSSKSTKTVKIKGASKLSKKITKLKKGKKYYIRVRAYKQRKNAVGKTLTYYGAWSSKTSIKCK